MKFIRAKIFLLILALMSYLETEATLSKSDKKKTSKIPKAEPSTENVYARGLVSESVKASDIVKEHSSYCDVEREVKKFEGVTLGYVTPWNSHGYDVAKLFSHKFTFISPVWFQMQRKGVNMYDLKGKQDVDQTWMVEVAKSGNVLIVPRILFGEWHLSEFQQLFSSEKEIEACVEALVDLVLKKKFDGVVIEMWSQPISGYKEQMIHFMGHLNKSMKEFHKTLILVLPPPLVRGNMKSSMVTKEDFEKVIPLVDAVSLMTYDFSEPNRPGPNSPINWIKSCVEQLEPDAQSANRKKILLGLNFYGYQYSTHPKNTAITGKQYIEFLANHKPKFQWNENNAEHFVKHKSTNQEILIYYPTLKSIDMRIQLARKLGVGVSIWEIGQGLDYFYDLL